MISLRSIIGWVGFAGLVLVELARSASGQVFQQGGVIPQHLTMWSTNNTVMDAGGAANKPQGLLPHELGLTAPPNKTGNPFPATATGTGPNGELACLYDSPLGTPGHYLCFSPNIGSSTAAIDVGALGGAPPSSFVINLNGVPLPVPGSITGLPEAANNPTLKTLATTTFSSVVRAGFATPGDAPPLLYVSSGSPCTLNGGAGDNGSQVQSADGKCWIASFPSSGKDVREWGAIGSGVVNDAPTVNAALATGGVVTFPAGHNFRLDSTVTAGKGTTIQCEENLAVTLSAGAVNLNPMIQLASDPSTQGKGASITGCYIVANAAGLNTGGTTIAMSGGVGGLVSANFIVGSCTGVDVNGNQPRVEHNYIANFQGTACNGIRIGHATTSANTIDPIINGNTTSGFNVSVYGTIANGSASVTGLTCGGGGTACLSQIPNGKPVYGHGIPSGATATYTSGNSLALSTAATVSGTITLFFDPGNAGIRIEDCGGCHIFQNDNVLASVGLQIIPGANQSVYGLQDIGNFDGDTTVATAIEIDTADASASIVSLQFTNAWAVGAGSPVGAPAGVIGAGGGITISNTGGATTLYGVHFNGLRDYNAGATNLFSITNSAWNYVSIDASSICGLQVPGSAVLLAPNVNNFYLRSSRVGDECDNSVQSPAGGALINLVSGNQDILILDNDLTVSTTLTPVTGYPGSGLIRDNLGIDNVQATVFVPSTAGGTPNMSITLPVNSYIVLQDAHPGGGNTVSAIQGAWPNRTTVTVLPSGDTAFVTGGNIAGNFNAQVGTYFNMVYSSSTNLWYLK